MPRTHAAVFQFARAGAALSRSEERETTMGKVVNEVDESISDVVQGNCDVGMTDGCTANRCGTDRTTIQDESDLQITFLS